MFDHVTSYFIAAVVINSQGHRILADPAKLARSTARDRPPGVPPCTFSGEALRAATAAYEAVCGAEAAHHNTALPKHARSAAAVFYAAPDGASTVRHDMLPGDAFSTRMMLGT